MKINLISLSDKKTEYQCFQFVKRGLLESFFYQAILQAGDQEP